MILEEINATNAASFEDLLASMNGLQDSLQLADSLNQVTLIMTDFEDEDYSSQIASTISPQSLQSNPETSILDLEQIKWN